MVLQQTIDNLRERPKHERQAVAFWIAVAVVLVLLIGWATFFFRSVAVPNLQPVNAAYTQAVQQVSTQTEPPPSPDDIGWVSSASQPASAADAANSGSDSLQIIQEDGTPVSDQTEQTPQDPYQ
jgi:hypothetical protein